MSSAAKSEPVKAGHRQWPFPSRRVVFAVAAVVTVLLGIDVAVREGAVLAPDLPLLFGAGLILFGMAYVLLLSAPLAASAAVCVLLAFVWSAGAMAICGIRVEGGVFAALLTMSGVGGVLILQQLYGAIADICRGKSVVTAVHASCARMAVPSACAFLIVLAALAVLNEGNGLIEIVAAGVASAGTIAAMNFVIAPAFASKVRFDEARIARANRARELAEGLVARAAIAARPRWAFAGLGIAAIVFAIILVGGNPNTPVLLSSTVVVWREGGAALGFAFLVTVAIAAWPLRDWRAVFFTALPAFLAATVVTVLARALGLAPDAALPALLVLGGGFGAVVCLLTAERFVAHRRFDGGADIAFQRSLNDCAMPVLAATAALALASILMIAAHPLGPAVALVLTGETLLSLLLAAIFTTVASDLFPQRRVLAKAPVPRAGK